MTGRPAAAGIAIGPSDKEIEDEHAREIRSRFPFSFFQPGGCCDGTAAMCLTRGELLPTDSDLKVGTIAGAPFYVDEEQYERSGRPRFVIDVGPGSTGGFSLEGPEDVHFISR